MIAIDLILRWMHILGAAVLVGGTIFQRFAGTAALSEESNDVVATDVRSRWSKLVMASVGLLLLSGFINFILIMRKFEIPKDDFPGSVYQAVFGIKFLLALGVFFLSSVLSGRSALAQRFRQKEKMWLTLNMVLAIVVVCLAGIMKLADRTPKPSESARPETSSVALIDRD